MTRVKIIFTIFGDALNPEIIGSALKLTPSAFWFKGDLVPNRKNGLVRKETCWEYSIGFIETLFLEDVSNELISVLSPNLDFLIKYINDNNLETKVDIVVEIVNAEIPCLFIDKNLMGTILKINGEIDVDIYCLDV
jgi:hypothetical protein